MTACTRTDAHSIGECPNYPAPVVVEFTEAEAQAIQVAYRALGDLGSIRPDWRADLTQAVALIARAREYRPLYDSGEDPHEEHRSSRSFDPDCTGCEKDAYDSFISTRED